MPLLAHKVLNICRSGVFFFFKYNLIDFDINRSDEYALSLVLLQLPIYYVYIDFALVIMYSLSLF